MSQEEAYSKGDPKTNNKSKKKHYLKGNQKGKKTKKKGSTENSEPK